MTTSLSSLFHAGLFSKHNFVVSQFKHLTPKTTSLEISKMWSIIFSASKLSEILRNLSRFQFIEINKTDQMFNIFVNFKDTKKVDHILKSSLDFQSLLDALYNIYR